MATTYNPKIITDGLVLNLDADDNNSYPGSGTNWGDLSGNGNDFTLEASGITHNSNGYFDLSNGGAIGNFNITDSTTCTFVFWMMSTDTQALWWKLVGSTSAFLGAYRVGNKEYYNSFGTGIEFHMDLTEPSNIYDNFPDGQWHMVEFKNVDMSGIDTNEFNNYSSYTFTSSKVGIIQLYDRNLTSKESAQNSNAQRSRFGV